MHAVAYRTTGIEEIELIRPLWEQINGYHHGRASYFLARSDQMTFDDRKAH
jgi:hypothetical protein